MLEVPYGIIITISFHYIKSDNAPSIKNEKRQVKPKAYDQKYFEK